MEGIAVLISEAYSFDSIGAPVTSEIRTEIFVTEKSLTRTDWRDAGQIGLNPSFILTTASVNYNGEQIVEYCGKRYSVYRTFYNNHSDEIEIYLKKKAGV